MSKKAVPTQKHTKEASAGHHSNRSESSLSNSEIGSLIDKKLTEANLKHVSELQTEVTKLTNQHLHDHNIKLQKLGEEFQEVNKGNSRRIEKIEEALTSLQQNYGQLEKKLKQQMEYFIGQKIQEMQRNVKLEAGGVKVINQEKCFEQLASKDAVHQEEMMKLHQQHHQDMLSVINDCCQKLKSGFSAQHKSYSVDEIHAVIDDIEQKMVHEILSEIQKTNTPEDLSSFEKVLQSSKQNCELGFAKEDVTKTSELTAEDISSALETFENETFDNWSDELRPSKNAGGGDLSEGPPQPVVEEVISKTQGMVTGDRGNLYYTEELKRTIDGVIAAGDVNAESSKIEEPEPESPQKTRTYSEVEKSLEAMILSDDTQKGDTRPQKKSADGSDQLKPLDALISDDIIEEESPSDVFKKDLESLDALLEVGTSAIKYGSDEFTKDLLSLDSKIVTESDKTETPSSKSVQAETKVELDPTTGKNVSPKSSERLVSHEIKQEADIMKETVNPKNIVAEKSAKQPTPAKESTSVQPTPQQSVAVPPSKQDKQSTTKETTTVSATTDGVKKS